LAVAAVVEAAWPAGPLEAEAREVVAMVAEAWAEAAAEVAALAAAEEEARAVAKQA
jgi:hypothetical protein